MRSAADEAEPSLAGSLPTMASHLNGSQDVGVHARHVSTVSTEGVDHVIGEASSQSQPSEVMSSVPNPILTSKYHLFFERKLVNGVMKSVCKGCGGPFSANTLNGTSSLKKHIEKSCPARKNKDVKQMLLGKAQVGGGKIVGNFCFDPKVSRELLLKAIVVHEYPLSMVDHSRFRTFISSLEPSFKMPTRSTIRRDAMSTYSEYKRRLMDEIEKNDSRISLTTDMWTASHQKKGYMAITAHYVDNSWRLRKRLLRFCYVPSPHGAENLTEYLIKSIDDWKLSHKLCALTVDNCTTNDAIIALLLRKIRKSALMLNGALFHVRCAAHILNLIVQDGLDVIGVGIEKVRKSVSFWTSTPKRIEKFEDAANTMNVQITRKLVLDCKTRWNSTYVMLETTLRYKEVFEHLKGRERKYDCLPSESEWEVTEKICKKLKIFYDVTELLSGTKYPTANHVCKELCKVKLVLTSWYVSEDGIIEAMAAKMQDKLDKYWDICYGIVGVAALLDPRYKKCLLEFYFNRIFPNQFEEKVQGIIDTAKKLVVEYDSKHGKSSNYIVDSTSTFEFNDQEEDTYNVFASSKRRRCDHVNNELKYFLDEPLEPMGSSSFDILQWWRLEGRKYPVLQELAKDLYAVPVSTVASETTFSTGGKIISPHRSRLNPLLVEALACCQNWLGIEEEDYDEEDCKEIIRNVFEDIEEDDDFGETTDASLRILELD